jgi:hypothetical protein
MARLSIRSAWVCTVALFLVATFAVAQSPPPGERPNLGPVRVTQEMIVNGDLNELELREAGLRMFTTPFNKLDGYGDGPMDPSDTVMPGGRPTLQGNGTFLRVNGLDAQTCLECHSVVSNASIPARLGIGGVGGSNSNAMIMPTAMDPADLEDLDSTAGFNGRFANPPFIFGAGGVELLGLEMTEDLQALEQYALDHPGSVVQLVTKGVSFGSIMADAYGEIDYSLLEGVDEDLVVKPFGRKGEFPTTRDFDLAAMQFHFGMQPVEVVGLGVDDDDDGVENEVMIGEHSALHIFVATIERPFMDNLDEAATQGFAQFQDSGCTNCHMPELQTRSIELPLRFPMVPTDPPANTYYLVDLTKQPVKFDPNDQGGVSVPLFADLKRHDMGDALAESFGLVDERTNREFTTARLWGIADTAPYLHDGRATTLTEAILTHGGEAQGARDNFAALSDENREDLLSFLRSLRTPEDPLRGGVQRRGSRIGRGGSAHGTFEQQVNP